MFYANDFCKFLSKVKGLNSKNVPLHDLLYNFRLKKLNILKNYKSFKVVIQHFESKYFESILFKEDEITVSFDDLKEGMNYLKSFY
jgi:hypothetical protein